MAAADELPILPQSSAHDENTKKRKHEEEENSTSMGMGQKSPLRQPDLPEFSLTSAKSISQETIGQKHSEGEWQTVENGRPKKKAKKIPKAGGNQYPTIEFAAKECRLSGPIKIGDLQNLVLYILADGMAPQFVSIRHRPQIRKVVVLMVPGLEESMFGTKPTSDGRRNSPDEYYPRKLDAEALPTDLKPFAEMFSLIWPVKTPGDRKYAKMHSPLHAMLTAPLTKVQKEDNGKAKNSRKGQESSGWQNKRTAITHFITSREDLQENGYTLHPALYNDAEDKATLAQERKTWEVDQTHGWVDTLIDHFDDGSVPESDFQQGSLTVGREILAMDCEMCKTGEDEFSLTRISIVSWDGSVVLDELVKPEKPIINYLTQYSGITEKMLAPVTTTLQDIQKKLLEILHPKTILIGHSLDSDLKALKLTHPYIIDTAVVYPHPRGPPLKSSLKWLAQKYLGKEIQKGHGATGHDSIEDAKTCLDLIKQKCEKGPEWGATDSQGENLFKRLARAGVRYKSQGGSAIPDLMGGKSSAAVDWGEPKRGPGGGATFSIGCKSDEEIKDGIIRAVKGDSDGKEIPGGGVDFVWGRFRELEDLKGWNNQKLPRSATPEATPATGASSALADDSMVVEDAPSEGGVLVGDATSSVELSGSTDAKDTQSSKSLVDDIAETAAAIDTEITESTESKAPAASEDSAKVSGSSGDSSSPEAIASATQALTQRIHKVYESLPPCTTFIVYSGSGDPREMVRLQKMKHQFQQEYKVKKWDQLSVKWTDVEEQAMIKATEDARNGIGFIGVK
ncbi:exonuclease protein [Rutstroemia sp. NJR-2017a WRK4]|nr:exonuclease protein [Rutstroemia sp. NJR-2017a WRK4]